MRARWRQRASDAPAYLITGVVMLLFAGAALLAARQVILAFTTGTGDRLADWYFRLTGLGIVGAYAAYATLKWRQGFATTVVGRVVVALLLAPAYVFVAWMLLRLVLSMIGFGPRVDY